jgi:hypothetical protein
VEKEIDSKVCEARGGTDSVAFKGSIIWVPGQHDKKRVQSTVYDGNTVLEAFVHPWLCGQKPIEEMQQMDSFSVTCVYLIFVFPIDGFNQPECVRFDTVSRLATCTKWLISTYASGAFHTSGYTPINGARMHVYDDRLRSWAETITQGHRCPTHSRQKLSTALTLRHGLSRARFLNGVCGRGGRRTGIGQSWAVMMMMMKLKSITRNKCT